jgi:hypothetical protein
VANYDRVLILTERDEMERALGEAVATANVGSGNLLAWPPDDYRSFLATFDSAAEGWRQWKGPGPAGPSPFSGGDPVAALAWWTDFAGRKHVRIVGQRQGLNTKVPPNVLCPRGGDRPPLWLVYPGTVFYREAGERRELLARCPRCGSLDNPEKLGWMGACCGPCHDRFEEGALAADTALPTLLHSPRGRIETLAWSADGMTLLAAGLPPSVPVTWQIRTGNQGPRLTGEGAAEGAFAAFHPDGRSVLTMSRGGALQRFQAGTGESSLILRTSPGVIAFALSPDGALIAVAQAASAFVYETLTGRLRHQLVPAGLRTPYGLTFSPNGRTVVVSQPSRALFWDTTTGAQAEAFVRPEAALTSMNFSPDGRLLAVGLRPSLTLAAAHAHRARGVLLWDVVARRELAVLPGPANAGTCALAWSPDAQALAAGGVDGSVTIWKAREWQNRVVLDWHPHNVRALAWSPDGQTLASAGGHNAIRLWPADVLR